MGMIGAKFRYGEKAKHEHFVIVEPIVLSAFYLLSSFSPFNATFCKFINAIFLRPARSMSIRILRRLIYFYGCIFTLR